MDSLQIVTLGMNEAKTKDVRWAVIDWLLGFADGHADRAEAERELAGLVDDPAALLEKVKGGNDDGPGETL